MKRLQKIVGNLKKKGSFKAFRPVLGGVRSFLFGSVENTVRAPHIVAAGNTKGYMLRVAAALLPTTLAAIYFYGWRAVVIILVSYLSAGLTEVFFAVLRKKRLEPEGLLVTGLIFALVLPPTLPLWIVALGAFFGTFFGKEVFGGLGRNIFNPALVGRIFLTAAFPALMSTKWQKPLLGGLGGFLRYGADAVTTATPLMAFRAGEGITHTWGQLFLGAVPGSLGETFRLGIVLGGVFLLLSRVGNWRIPVSYLGSVLLFSGVGYLFWPGQVASPQIQLVSGALLFGAFFMATDPVTSPFTKAGKWFFGFVLGFLTVLFRAYSGYVEGVAFGLLLANALAPLIDNLVLKVQFKKSKEKGWAVHG